MIQIRRALISVYHKDGLEELLKALHGIGCSFVSTGGTARFIQEQGYPCERVEDLTGFPEILDGRVKTLHPKIFGGILMRSTTQDKAQLAEHGVAAFQLVVVNLYPFRQALAEGDSSREQMVELIDIGGVALLRAAAKNHQHCVVLADKADYAEFVQQLGASKGAIPPSLSADLAARCFTLTAAYDQAISDYLRPAVVDTVPRSLNLQPLQTLAYGENPHQRGWLLSDGKPSLMPEQLAGKPLSYNNLIDLDGCLGILGDFLDTTACAIVKHANPCGIAVGDTALQAYERAVASDPTSAFGGIVGFSRPVDLACATEMAKKFYEIIVAPDFAPEALALLKQKPKLRLMRLPMQSQSKLFAGTHLRQTLCGYLLQERDSAIEDLRSAKVVTKRAPQAEEMAAMQMAWRACKWVKSNAIVLANASQTVGIGAGQMSRVDAVELALRKAVIPLSGVALASDAFLPFRDSIDIASRHGIRAVVQPGGSIRDAEVIEAADASGIAMLFTGYRHFRH